MNDVLAKAQRGDREARGQIVQQYMGMVVNEAKRAAKQHADIEDCIQEGSLAILRAVDKYDPEKGSFTAYALRSVRNAMCNARRAQMAVREETGLEEDRIAVLPDEDRPSLPPSVRGWISSLGRVERQFVYLAFGAKDGIERTPRDLAAIYDRSPWAVYKKIEKIKREAQKEVVIS